MTDEDDPDPDDYVPTDAQVSDRVATLPEEATPEDRARALQSLLIEEGHLSTDAVDEIVAKYEHDIGPLNGARVVASAWTDPDYRERLLDDANGAVAELGVDLDVQDVDLVAVPNDGSTHNLVVCTLCSCYPWAVLGLPPTWYKSAAYRSRAVREPRTLLAEEFGVNLADDVDVEVWDSTSEQRYFVLPRRPPGTEGMDEDELIELVSRDAMIGVDRLDDRPAADGGAGATRPDAAGTGVPADVDAPGLDDDPTFAAPWQARAFALTVALTDDAYGWDDFRSRLVDRIDARPDATLEDASEAAYYRAWLAAVESLLVDLSLVDPATYPDRVAEFAATDRTAEEFAEGVHSHDHDHGHAGGRSHGHDRDR
ncbi:MAG: nitrile hydratase subunit alpha [Haloferacaceae archaeon]